MRHFIAQMLHNIISENESKQITETEVFMDSVIARYLFDIFGLTHNEITGLIDTSFNDDVLQDRLKTLCMYQYDKQNQKPKSHYIAEQWNQAYRYSVLSGQTLPDILKQLNFEGFDVDDQQTLLEWRQYAMSIVVSVVLPNSSQTRNIYTQSGDYIDRKVELELHKMHSNPIHDDSLHKYIKGHKRNLVISK